jgi:Thioredoxin like C-terminal domain
VRYHHFGEGKYDETESHIQQLLKESNAKLTFHGSTEVSGTGTEAPPDSDVESPETYVGYDRADSFLSPGGFVRDAAQSYTVPQHLELNQWGLSGNWTDRAQAATLNTALGKIVFRFHTRDVHLVLGPTKAGKPVRFRVKIDGKASEENHGVDTDSAGNGTVVEQRLYQSFAERTRWTTTPLKFSFSIRASKRFRSPSARLVNSSRKASIVPARTRAQSILDRVAHECL